MVLGEPTKPDPDLAGVPEPGQTVSGKYYIEERLGVGGMGAVLRARRLTDGIQVAVKVMLAEEAQHHDSTKRFFREARAVGSIKSPHVTRLIDLGRLDDGLPFMVLELLHGLPLDAIIEQEAPLPIALAVDYVLQACEGVAEAHALGVIHRDLKPSNLFRAITPDGTVIKVLDFGISKASMRLEPGSDQKSLTETNTTLGSPQYMSPEQLRSSKDVDARTDVWALGLILHKLCTGTPAFEATTVGEHFAMIFADPPTPLRARRPDAPASLERAILTCLQRDLDKRFGDVGQLAMAIAPYGHRDGLERATRVVATLERAGVSSSATPRIPLDGASVSRNEAPTVRVGGGADTPHLAGLPPHLARSSAPIENATTSQWSSLSRTTPPAMDPPRALAAAAALVALAAAALAGAWILVGGETPLRASAALEAPLGRLIDIDEIAAGAPAEDDTAPDFDPAAVKVALLDKLARGEASEREQRMLLAICSSDNPDEACRAALDKLAESAPQAKAQAKAKPKRPAPPPPKSAPPDKAPPTSPPPEPSAIKPKGPMAETL